MLGFSKGPWTFYPLFLVWTDNAPEFTLRYTIKPNSKNVFERTILDLGLMHGRCDIGAPWQNGIVERSHRTDNEELFHVIRFTDPEMRRYQLKLWDFEYNTRRPHQGLGGRIPMQVYLAEYGLHASSRMLT